MPQAILVLARSPALRARAPERAPDRRAAQRDDLRLSTEHALAGLPYCKILIRRKPSGNASFLSRQKARWASAQRELPPIGGEPHDQAGEPLCKLWWKVRSYLPPPSGAALLPPSVQGKLPCENRGGLCALEKVVRPLLQRRKVMGPAEMTRVRSGRSAEGRAIMKRLFAAALAVSPDRFRFSHVEARRGAGPTSKHSA